MNSKQSKNNLLAIGSAAVLAVYAAGFFRTRAAAQRFADDSEQRRPAPAQVDNPADVPVLQRVDSAPVAPKKKAQAVAVLQIQLDSARVPIDFIVPAVTPLPPVVLPPAPVAPPPPPSMPVPVVVDMTPPPVEKATNGLKDGTYRGWGTSRHGDIEAAVDIKDGKISAAYITQCLTRYSCSWIGHLPGQVLARQSANVDYVSGATQSSNAFYHAILEAITKAK